MSYAHPLKLSFAGAVSAGLLMGVSQSTIAQSPEAPELDLSRKGATLPLDQAYGALAVQVGDPAAPVRFERFPWSDQTFMVSGTKVSPWDEKAWIEAGRPEPAVVPWIEGTKLKTYGDQAEVWLELAGTTRPLSPEELASLGERPVVNVPSSYVRYPWAPLIYKVDKVPSGDVVVPLDESQWIDQGAPEVSRTDWVEGTVLYSNGSSDEVIAVEPSFQQIHHKLTAEERAAVAARPVEKRSGMFVKVEWDGTVYYTDPQGGVTEYVPQSPELLKVQGDPTPTVVSAIPGAFFYKVAGSEDLYYSAPGVDRAATAEEWAKAGSPEPVVVGS